MAQCPRSPSAPAGRTIILTTAFQNLVNQASSGDLSEGAVVGSCGPCCGDITVRRSGPGAKYPHRLYAACGANSSLEHKSFFWLTKEEPDSTHTATRQLFGEMRVPHTLKRGMHLRKSGGPLFSLLLSEGTKYILTVPKRCKLKHLQDQRIRLRMPNIEDLKEGEVLVSDSFGRYGEVCALSKVGLFAFVCYSGARSDHCPRRRWQGEQDRI